MHQFRNWEIIISPTLQVHSSGTGTPMAAPTFTKYWKFEIKQINIDVKIRTNPRLGRFTWMQSLCPMSPFLCSFGKPLVREAKSSPGEDYLITTIFPFKRVINSHGKVISSSLLSDLRREDCSRTCWVFVVNDGTVENVDCRLAYLLLKELSSLQVHSDFAIKIHLDVNDEPPTSKIN